MLYLIDDTTAPDWNLAAEEYILTSFSEPVCRLWRNSKAVIVGRYQNTAAEINAEYVLRHNIPVIRRLTGGGAVFHDLGNINYTFTDKKIPGEDTSAMFRRFTSPIVSALRSIGIQASLKGRNDLVIDGRKFSGNAVCIHDGRVLQHGTILFSASVEDLSGALNPRPEKFIGKGVRSNRSRVTNISEHLPADKANMSVEEFMARLQEYLLEIDKSGVCRGYTGTEKAAIEKLRQEKYSTWEWNFGTSPKYGLSRIRKLPAGLIEISLDVDGGIIRSCSIQGDYFFTRPTEEVEQALVGLPHSIPAVSQALSGLPLADYFGPVSPSDLLALIF